MLHKLDFSESSTTESQVAQPVVDDERLVANNQDSSSYSSSSTGTSKNMQKKSLIIAIIISVLAITAGVGTGYGSSRLFATSSGGGSTVSGDLEQVPSGTIKEGDVFGSQDTSTFKDPVKGYLEKGGLDGEGSHKLLRDGGPSQTVYMTSSVTDLDKFEGMEVEVYGETFSGQKAGWLMDVGRVEVLKVSGEKPAQEE